MPKKPEGKLVPEMFHIDRRDPRSLQMQLTSSIISVLLDTRAEPCTKMPSTRKMAETLYISRLTVTIVYNELVSQGYLEPLPRSGYVVSEKIPHRRIDAIKIDREVHPVDWAEALPNDLTKRRQIEKPRTWRLMKYPFIYGQIDPKLFDHNAWRDCARRALGARDFAELAGDQFGQDDPVLIDYIRKNTLPRRGIRAAEDEVLITLGGQNAIWLCIALLSQRPIKAATEDPGFPDFSAALRQFNIPTSFTKGDEHGLLPESIPSDTDIIFTTPSHSIPSGITMSRDRREALLRKADQDNFLILEDDYEYEMSFLEKPSPSLKSMDASGRVIYVGSFSKSLFPGLRIGYMVAHRDFIRQARALRAMILRHPPVHMQRVTGYFLALGHYDAHIVRVRSALKERREILVDALKNTDFTIKGAARHGGSSLWVQNEFGIDSKELLDRLVERSVYAEPGHWFFEKPTSPCSFMRLGYSSIRPELIGEGVQILQEELVALNKAHGNRKAMDIGAWRSQLL